ncbi:MAG: alpha/beta fold hydrolase [Pseudomonadota bacterium]
MADPIVLLPGLQSDKSSWVHQVDHFGATRQVIVPEGHQHLTSIPAMAAHVKAVLPARFHLVAWSMGGYIALELLPDVMGALQSLTFIATSARAEDPAATVRRHDRIALAERVGMEEASRQNLELCCHDPALAKTPALLAMNAAAQTLGLAAFRAQQEAIIHRADRRDRLGSVTCPTLVIVGEDDPVIPPDDGREIHRGVPGAVLEMIAACGHCPPVEHPGIVNAALARHFERAEAASTGRA